jgi:hypothetical protein
MHNIKDEEKLGGKIPIPQSNTINAKSCVDCRTGLMRQKRRASGEDVQASEVIYQVGGIDDIECGGTVIRRSRPRDASGDTIRPLFFRRSYISAVKNATSQKSIEPI